MKRSMRRILARGFRLMRWPIRHAVAHAQLSSTTARPVPALSRGNNLRTKRVPLSKKKPIQRPANQTAANQSSESSQKQLQQQHQAQHQPQPQQQQQQTATEQQHDPPKFAAEEPPLTNPFPLLAHSTENIDLASRLRSYANNFGVVGALWCTLSITALTMTPIEDVYKETERADGQQQQQQQQQQRKQTATHYDGMDKRRSHRRRPILVKYFGVPEPYLEDFYMAAWSCSFFSSAVGLGLSTVVAGLVASTAPSYIKIFVRRHSDILIALPICQGLSSGFAAIGLSVGLDEARGEPVSWIGYIGTIVATSVVGGSTFQVLKGYKASRKAGKVQITSPKEAPKDGGSP